MFGIDDLAIAALVGSVGSSATSLLTSSSSASKNKREAERQRMWQTQMSDTAHQREVADLKAAGLNPVLSATGGSGASTGSSGLASADISAGEFDPFSKYQMLKQMKTQSENTAKDTALKGSQIKTQTEQQKLLQEQTKIASGNAKLIDQQSTFWKEHPNLYAISQVMPIIQGAIGAGNMVTSAGSLINEIMGSKKLPPNFRQTTTKRKGNITVERSYY